jgi:hypothetical protein
MKLKLSNLLHATDGWGVLAQVLVQQLEILLERGGRALLEGVVRCPRAAGPGEEDSDIYQGDFP